MNQIVIIGLAILVGLLVIFCIRAIKKSKDENADKENWYPYYTYVNTPRRRGIYPTSVSPYWWGGNYYQRLNWFPWGYHHPGYYQRRRFPGYGGYGGYRGYGGYGGYEGLEPAGGPDGPMLASLPAPQFSVLGTWDYYGVAYTIDPNDHTILNLYQLNLDPDRDLYQYKVETKDGIVIPLNNNITHLKDGSKFKVSGMEGKGLFVADVSKYEYAYI